jgi:hypothetical protein
MSERTERHFPVVLGAAAGIAFFVTRHGHGLPAHWPDLLAAAISVASIAVGFFAAGKAGVVSSAGDPGSLVGQLQEAGLYQLFLSYIDAAINWSFVVAGLSAGLLLVNFDSKSTTHAVLFALWVCVAVLAGATYYRAVRVLGALERRASRRHTPRASPNAS